MQFFIFAVLTVFVPLGAMTSVSAQVDPPDLRFLQTEIPDELADQVLALVKRSLGKAVGEDRRPLPPQTETEKSRPLFERAQVKEIFDVGAASGLGELCGLDWQSNNFLPLMKRERARGDRTPHQLAAIGMIHGIGQQYASNTATCTSDDKIGTAAFYNEKWVPPAAR